jgi:hypothetical protein
MAAGSITLAQAQRMAQSPLMKGVILEILTVDAWSHLFPFEEAPGGQLIYNRELAAALVKWHTVGATTARTQATVTTITANVYTLEHTVQVEQHLQTIYQSPNDQMATQVLLGAKAMWQEYQQKLITGVTGSNQPDGLRALCPAGQYVDPGTTTGQALSCKLLDDVLAKVTASNGRVDAFVMGVREIKGMRKLQRTLPHGPWGMLTITNPSDTARPLNLTTYAGVPIFRNDYITATETIGTVGAKSRFWAVSFEPKVGLTGLRPPGIDNLMAMTPEFYDKDDASIFRRQMLFVGTALYSQHAIAGAKNVTATTATT